MIEAGEYVRTKKRGIFKVLSIRKTPYGYLCGTTDNLNNGTFTIGKGGTAEIKKDIIKHSKNIIDLIEVGDYVNGYRVDRIVEDLSDNRNSFVVCNEYLGEKQRYKQHNIRAVVTHEQFAQMEYKL